jgi:hypothetical protein
MKAWNGYGSEHSMNLVMIGRFTEAHDAKEAVRLIERLTEQASAESTVEHADEEDKNPRFSEAMSKILNTSKIYSIGPAELEQFTYDVQVSVADSEVVITTDEVDVSAFLKLLLDKGARIEVYSAHTYPDTGHGRGG